MSHLSCQNFQGRCGKKLLCQVPNIFPCQITLVLEKEMCIMYKKRRVATKPGLFRAFLPREFPKEESGWQGKLPLKSTAF